MSYLIPYVVAVTPPRTSVTIHSKLLFSLSRTYASCGEAFVYSPAYLKKSNLSGKLRDSHLKLYTVRIN